MMMIMIMMVMTMMMLELKDDLPLWDTVLCDSCGYYCVDNEIMIILIKIKIF